jgi:hypothetical protein
MREAAKEERLAFLRKQIDEQNGMRASWNRTKHGEIGSGFFENFGKDCR